MLGTDNIARTVIRYTSHRNTWRNGEISVPIPKASTCDGILCWTALPKIPDGGSILCLIENVSPFSTEDITDWLQVAGAEFGLANTPEINQHQTVIKYLCDVTLDNKV